MPDRASARFGRTHLKHATRGIAPTRGSDDPRLKHATRGPLPLRIVSGGLLVALLVRSIIGYLSARELGLMIVYASVMMAVCMVACIVPTRRALGVEPTEALGGET